mmetsp:Transcript_92132/g.192626  ORF Transcript_92132/g.192626 Transcript_92132/m.192626 type:complete len:273 (+) Transcript_92132:228-1046(+)
MRGGFLRDETQGKVGERLVQVVHDVEDALLLHRCHNGYLQGGKSCWDRDFAGKEAVAVAIFSTDEPKLPWMQNSQNLPRRVGVQLADLAAPMFAEKRSGPDRSRIRCFVDLRFAGYPICHRRVHGRVDVARCISVRWYLCILVFFLDVGRKQSDSNGNFAELLDFVDDAFHFWPLLGKHLGVERFRPCCPGSITDAILPEAGVQVRGHDSNLAGIQSRNFNDFNVQLALEMVQQRVSNVLGVLDVLVLIETNGNHLLTNAGATLNLDEETRP